MKCEMCNYIGKYVSKYRGYICAYLFCIAIGIAAVLRKDTEGSWIGILSHAGFVVSIYYTFSIKRTDVALITILLLLTSILWHTRETYENDNKQKLDTFASVFLAAYTYGGAIMPITLIAPVSLIYSIFIGFLVETDLEYTVPVAAAYVIYVGFYGFVYKQFYMDRCIFLAVVVGLAAACYFVEPIDVDGELIDIWHPMWHVLSAISIPLALHLKKEKEEEGSEKVGGTGDGWSYTSVPLRF